MAQPFGGKLSVDVRDSVPDWGPFEPPRAPDGAPNVLYIVLDDVGFSAMSCYGGPIDTPNIDRIAAAGLRYTQWHTTALCSPTRSCLLTGRNHTRNSMACITEAAIGFPNASGTVPAENGMLSEILGEAGWNTYMVGKWHLCPTDEMNLASTRRNWPSGRGFERWYGFLGAETNQWYPDVRQGQPAALSQQLRRRRGADDRRLRGDPYGRGRVPVGIVREGGHGADVRKGTLSLYHGDKKVGEEKIKTQLGFYAIAGTSLYVGRQPGEPVTDDYPGETPYEFTRGTLRLVSVNVSGKPFTDLEHHAAMLLKHQ